MTTNEVLTIVFKVVGVLFVSVMAPFVIKILKQYSDKIGDDKLRKTIESLVYAAEQTLKEKDPTGSLRKKYVIDQLAKLGISVTGYVDALIEECVNGIGTDHFSTKETEALSNLDEEPDIEEQKPTKKSTKKK